jgi:hypothetical protein
MKGDSFRPKTWIYVVLTVPLLTCCGLGSWGGLTAYRFFDMSQAAGEVDAAKAEYLRLGLPFVAADIKPNPAVQDNENAAPLLRKAAVSVQKLGFSRKAPGLRKLIIAGKVDEVIDLLEPMQPAMAIAKEAAKRPRLDYKRDWDLGVDVLFPELASVKALVHSLCARAQVRAKRGDVTGAVDDFRTSLKLAALTGQEPGLIPTLVLIACERITLDAIHRAASDIKHNQDALVKLQSLLRERTPRPSLEAAIRGDIFMGLATIRNLPRFSKKIRPLPGIERGGVPKDKVRRAYMARHMQLWNMAWKATRSQTSNPIAMGQTLDEVGESITKQRSQSQVMNASMYPVLGQSGKAFVTLEADWRVTDALVTLLLMESKVAIDGE